MLIPEPGLADDGRLPPSAAAPGLEDLAGTGAKRLREPSWLRGEGGRRQLLLLPAPCCRCCCGSICCCLAAKLGGAARYLRFCMPWTHRLSGCNCARSMRRPRPLCPPPTTPLPFKPLLPLGCAELGVVLPALPSPLAWLSAAEGTAAIGLDSRMRHTALGMGREKPWGKGEGGALPGLPAGKRELAQEREIQELQEVDPTASSHASKATVLF